MVVAAACPNALESQNKLKMKKNEFAAILESPQTLQGIYP